MKDVIIIGAGAVGAFIARSLSRYDVDALIIEKEYDVGDVTSMANSAIAHSGYDPVPGTKKAIFNVKGNRMMDQVCDELDVQFDKCGTLTIALYDEQLPMLEDLKKRADQNGVPAEILTKEQVIAIEPNISKEVKGALLCPTGGNINPFALTAHAVENALDNGIKITFGEEVTAIEKIEGGFKVTTSKNVYEAKVVINAAGLHSDDIARMIEPIDWSIHARKGEYYVLNHFAWGFVKHVLFPLPSEKGKGILVTQTTSGNYLVGPSSEWVDDKEDMSTDTLTLADVRRQATEMVPNIPFQEQIRVYAGLRATPSTHDFIIEPSKSFKDFINVAGIESPGLVSSPAIGEYVVEELVKAVLPLKEKANWNPRIKPYIRTWNLSQEEKNELIKKNPHYGKVVCGCEKVTLGEIEDAMSRSLPINSIKALKKRTRAGFGKCQGGFCQPTVLNIIAMKKGISPLEVKYDGEGSEIVKVEVKKEAK